LDWTDWTVTDTNCVTGSCVVATGNVGLYQTFGGVPTVDITDVSFWASHPGVVGVEYGGYDFLYLDGSYDEFVFQTNDPGWSLFDATANLRPNDTLTGFEIWGYVGLGAPNVTMADDISIMATPEPRTLNLILIDLGAFTLAAIRAVRAKVPSLLRL
jgi:hypothetical protein